MVDVEPSSGKRKDGPSWTFLTNYGHVLVCIWADPDVRLRDIATQVGITERAVFGIVSDLEAEGYLIRERVGRRNRYTVNAGRPLRHPVEQRHSISELLAAVAPPPTVGA